MPLVNNPGGGNCGYYAFSVAMIEIIQQQLQLGDSLLLAGINDQLSEGVEPFKEADFRDFSLADYAKNTATYRRPFLDRLQKTLREVATSAYKQDLKAAVSEEILMSAERLSKVDGNETFMKFMNIVYATQGKALSEQDNNFNELAHSPAVYELAARVVADFKPDELLDEIEQDKLLVQIAKHHFKQDTVVSLKDGFIFNPDSCILPALDKIGENGYWATHDHLKKIAEVLDVNLDINGHNCGQMKPDRPIVVLNNASNVHWTTEVHSLTTAQTTKSAVAPSLPQMLSEEEQTVFDVSTESARASGIAKGVLIDYLDFLVRYANVDSLFEVKKDDSPDEALAKQLQEQELIEVGLRPKK